MKYPPAKPAHWEGAVGHWLRSQLDARGIDAPAYGRYVLSLLTRPLDPADLGPSPLGDKLWERRNPSELPPLKAEALKRSAAVQCLLNASDDKNSGIEQLVDELCSKLKEVEDVNLQNGKKELQISKVTRKERARQLSPAEMARLYYAAFPALVPLTPASGANCSLASCADRPLDSDASCNYRYKDFFVHKQQIDHEESLHFKKQSNKDRRFSINSHRSRNRGNYKHRNCHRKNANYAEELPEWVNNGDAWDMDSQDLTLNSTKSSSQDEGYATSNDVVQCNLPSTKRLYERDIEFFLNSVGDETFSKSWNTEAIFELPDKSIADEESIAKFKAKFDHSLEALWPKEQNNNIDYELPMDFHEISSPSERIYGCYSADKQLPLSMTNSIWSNNEFKCDWDGNELLFHSNNFNRSSCTSEIKDSNQIFIENSNPWSTNCEPNDQESMEVIYNKLKPLNLDDTNETSFTFKTSSCETSNYNLTFKKWNDLQVIEPVSLLFEANPLPVGTPAHSFNILNHSNSCSSFTEVIPKSSSGFIGDSLKRKSNVNLKLDVVKSIDGKDDEDLLTSMRTHFRPIKHDAGELSQTNVKYVDGMTFPIVSDLDLVKFSRSISGSIFLESDSEPPKQYMEYRKQGIDYSRLDIRSSSVCSDEGLSSNDLILKFKVCQTEKSVQTDFGDKSYSDNNVLFATKKYDLKKKLANDSDAKSVHNVDTESEIEISNFDWIQCDQCKLKNDQWTTDNSHSFCSNTTKIWSSEDNYCKKCIEQQAKIRKIKSNSVRNENSNEESAREWDELLSDLRYIHDIKLDNNWSDQMSNEESFCIAPTEISFSARDGNFIKSALMAQTKEKSVINDVKAWLIGTNGKIESNAVGKILDQSLIMYSTIEPHCEVCFDSYKVKESDEGWRIDRKRRHSAVNNGRVKGVGKLRCTLPSGGHSARALHMPFLHIVDRPLTR